MKHAKGVMTKEHWGLHHDGTALLRNNRFEAKG